MRLDRVPILGVLLAMTAFLFSRLIDLTASTFSAVMGGNYLAFQAGGFVAGDVRADARPFARMMDAGLCRTGPNDDDEDDDELTDAMSRLRAVRMLC